MLATYKLVAQSDKWETAANTNIDQVYPQVFSQENTWECTSRLHKQVVLWTSERISAAFMSTPLHRLSLILRNHGNWQKKKSFKRPVCDFSASWLRVYLRISCWHGTACRGRAELLMHVSTSWWSDAWSRVHLPGRYLAYLLIAPTYSQLIARTVAPLHPLTVHVWLAAGHLMPTLPEQGV